MRRYSRLTAIERKKNIRKAFLLFVLTIVLLSGFIAYGLPAIVKFSAFLTEIRQSTEDIEVTDTTPPPPPHFNPLPSATKEDHIEIKGNAEPGSKVKLFIGKDKVEILANKDGDFVHDLPLSKGENVFSAIAVDSSGNESKNTQEYNIIFDNEPPTLEITKPESGQEFYGPKERQMVIEGVTEENCQVRVNGRVVVVESDGSFSFSTTLADGDNMFEIKSQDEAENITESKISVTYEP